MEKLFAWVSLLLPVLVSLNANAAVGQSATCVRNDVSRLVELRVESPTGVPCSVVYLRPDMGIAEETLWQARNEPEYCVTQFRNFLVKLEQKHSWSCESNQDSWLGTSEPENPGKTNSNRPNIEAGDTADKLSTTNIQKTIDANDLTTENLISEPTQLLVGLQLREPQQQREPDFHSALPVIPGNLSTSGGTGSGNRPAPLTMDTLRTLIPTATYTTDLSVPHAGNTVSCPSNGFFIWNTRNPQKPVFEMGATFEFAIDIADMAAVDTVTTAIQDADADPNTQTCVTSVRYSACQLPDYRQGADLWNTNHLSFSCGQVMSTQTIRTTRFAVFQNRALVDNNADACFKKPSIVHMALAPVFVDSGAMPVEGQPAGIELVIVSANGGPAARPEWHRAVCRYSIGG